MIKHLSKQHQVTVGSLVRSTEEKESGRGLGDYCDHFIVGEVSEKWQYARMLLRLPTFIPSSMGYFYSRALKLAIRREIETQHYDLIFVHCSSVAQYVEDIYHLPKILDFGDMDSQKWLIYTKVKSIPVNIGYWLEGKKLLKEEKRLATKFDLCTCTTREEFETLNNYATGAATDWFPNGVDHSYFVPSGEDYDPNLISFVGRMDYFPNQACMFDFCRNVLPLLRQRKPAIRLTIVGANPSVKVKALGKLPGVTVTGAVPDVRPYVRSSAAMVAPLTIARGTQNKLLETMAMGVPVVTSGLAARGVDAVPGKELFTANTPEEYCDSILALLDNRDERQRLGIAGRNCVTERHDWSKSMERLDNIIARCVNTFDSAIR